MKREDQEKLLRWLDAYVDNRLDPAQRGTFEKLVQRTPALRAELERQRDIDASLRKHFQPPTADGAIPTLSAPARIKGSARLDLSETAPKHSLAVRFSKRAVVAMAAAAAIVLGVVGAWWQWGRVDPTDVAVTQPRTLQWAYARAIDHGFKPQWVCENDEQFADTFRDKLREELLLSKVPEGIEPLGLAYVPLFSAQTTYLLVRVDGRPVIVFVDRFEKHKEECLPVGPGLRSFTRRVGGLMLYEVTPLAEPRVLDLFYQPLEGWRDPP